MWSVRKVKELLKDLIENGNIYQWDEAVLYSFLLRKGLLNLDNRHKQFFRNLIELQFNQIEAFLLNATIWNYDLYNTDGGKDNWNLENYSLLGPNRKPRNIDVVSRPYLMRSSAEPTHLSFDIDSKYASIILKGKLISNEPTVVYIPFDIHYSPEFTIWATSNEVNWDKENQLLYWYPSKDYIYNQLIIGKGKINKLDTNMLPRQSKEMADKTVFTASFN